MPTDDGRMLTTIRELTQPAFGTETWYEQNFNAVLYLLEAFDLEPSLAPDDANHVLGFDGGELTDVVYASDAITLDFAAPGRVRLKLITVPASVDAPSTWDPFERVSTVNHAGGRVVVELGASVDAPSARLAASLTAAPNPFNPRTTIAWELPGDRPVDVRILDARGRHVAWIAARRCRAGFGGVGRP